MANSLGALSLPDQIIWADQYNFAPVAGQAVRTIAGGFAMFTQSMAAGQPVTLEARDGVAWLTQANVDTLMTMAAQAGTVFLLTLGALSFNVRFAHHTPPVVDFSPLWPMYDQYTGTIKLVTV